MCYQKILLIINLEVSMPIRILALDTATEACSVALYNDGELTSFFEVCPQKHTQRILPLIDRLLAESGITLNQLDALAFGKGPGSFTGVRIGIGIAQGLALGVGLPLIGVSTLQTMAEGCKRVNNAHQVLSGIDARMGEIYLGCYKIKQNNYWQDQQPEAVLTPQQLISQLSELDLQSEWLLAGTAWLAYPDLAKQVQDKIPACQLVHSSIEYPSALDMLPLALQAWQDGLAAPVAQVEPSYLRNNVAWKKLPGRE